MTFPSGGLNEHRQNVKDNQNCFVQDKERTIARWVDECWKYVKDSTTINRKKSYFMPILKEMAELVWTAQGGEPLFQFYSNLGLPMSWNRPQYGERNYICYEIGHVNPRLNGGVSHPNNLTFQSARCNQHIQSSLAIDEVMIYFENNEEVLNRMNSVHTLHKSPEWNTLIKFLGIE